MMMTQKMRILLICDTKDWITCQIAFYLKNVLSKDFDISILVSTEKKFLMDLIKKQKHVDVVHFLFTSEFNHLKNYIYIPIVVTIWHVVSWTQFDQNFVRIDQITTGSEQWKKNLENHFPTKTPISRLSYGIDIKKFFRNSNEKTKFIQKKNLSPDTLVFGFTGKTSSNDSNRKGIDRLFNCLIELKKNKDINFILRITGKGWQKEMIPVELHKFVQIEPFLESSELPNFYSSLDFYVCTSTIEGVPYPVLESMACECIVLATSVGIVPEIINNNENGFILNESSLTSDFIKNIEYVIKNKNLMENIGKNARSTIIERFDWNKIQPDDYHRIYVNCKKSFSERFFFDKFHIILGAHTLILSTQIRTRLRSVKVLFFGWRKK